MSKPQTITLYSSAYGSYSLQVVGEESYQDEIKQVVTYDDDGIEKFREDGLTAELILEDNNPHDRGYAVRVDIDHRTVGYLSKPDARKYRAGLAQNKLKDVTGTCYAAVSGRYNDEKENMLFGVWLDLNVDRLVILSQPASSKRMAQKAKPTRNPKTEAKPFVQTIVEAWNKGLTEKIILIIMALASLVFVFQIFSGIVSE